jgi:hypothetical protein
LIDKTTEETSIVTPESQEDLSGVTTDAALPVPPLVETPEPPANKVSAWRYIFLGPNGLRPGWGLLFFVLIFLALGAALNLTIRKLHPAPAKTAAQIKAQAAAGATPRSMLIGEGSAFALVEGRQLLRRVRLGIRISRRSGRNAVEGRAAGLR